MAIYSAPAWSPRHRGPSAARPPSCTLPVSSPPCRRWGDYHCAHFTDFETKAQRAAGEAMVVTGEQTLSVDWSVARG